MATMIDGRHFLVPFVAIAAVVDSPTMRDRPNTSKRRAFATVAAARTISQAAAFQHAVPHPRFLAPPLHHSSQQLHEVSVVRRRGRSLAAAPVVDDGVADLNAPLKSQTIAEDVELGDLATSPTEGAAAVSVATGERNGNNKSGGLLSDMPLTAVALLNAVAVIWGTQHAVIKTVVDDCDASAFSFARFGLAAALVVPYVPPIGPAVRKLMGSGSDGVAATDEGTAEADDDSIAAWRWGLEMGCWMFLGYAFQAIGLEFTTAQRSGFLLYLNVKFVPFFARILFGREISVPTWASAFTALVGTALLSFDGTNTALNVGDLWSVAAAAASAMFILRLESASKAVPDSSALNAACLLVVTAASLVWTVGETYVSSAVGTNLLDASQKTIENVVHTVTMHPFALIYLGGITTALANYIQTKAQKDISAERASIIYAMDPVYGAVFANLLLGETLNSYGMVGAGIITVAAATNAFLDLGPAKDSGAEEKGSNK